MINLCSFLCCGKLGCLFCCVNVFRGILSALQRTTFSLFHGAELHVPICKGLNPQPTVIDLCDCSDEGGEYHV